MMVAIILLTVIVVVVSDRVMQLEAQFDIHHIDSDDWAESANALGIHPDSMTMGEFKDHDSTHTIDATYRDRHQYQYYIK